MVALKRAILGFSGVRLHRVVVPDPIQDIPKDVVLVDTTPKKLLQVQMKQSVTGTVHLAELCLGICPSTLHCINMQHAVVGIDKVQPVVDYIVWLWQLIVSLSAICDYASSWKDMLGNDQNQGGCIMVFNSHHAHISITLDYTKDPVALTVMAAVVLLVHELTFIHLNCLTWPTNYYWII